MLSALVLAVTLHTTPLTGALYRAGGGAGDGFSTVRALDTMFGAAEVQAEFEKLQAQYGESTPLVDAFDFAMRDAWHRAGQDDVRIASGSSLDGRGLALAVIRAGSHKNRFSVERLFGSLFPPRLAGDVLLDLDTKYGTDRASQFRKLADTFFADMGSDLGDTALKGAAGKR